MTDLEQRFSQNRDNKVVSSFPVQVALPFREVETLLPAKAKMSGKPMDLPMSTKGRRTKTRIAPITWNRPMAAGFWRTIGTFVNEAPPGIEVSSRPGRTRPLAPGDESRLRRRNKLTDDPLQASIR